MAVKPSIISVPKDKGWKDMTYPKRALTMKEIRNAMRRKGFAKQNEKSKP